MGVDFRDPAIALRIAAWVSDRLPRALEGSAAALTGAFAFVLLVSVIEAVRLLHAQSEGAALEARHARLSESLNAIEARERAIGLRRGDLAAALALRRSNALRAADIVRVGNVLPPAIALTALRSADGGWDLEGRTESIGDVERTLARLQTIGRASADTIFEVHREEAAPQIVSFALGVRQR